MLSWNDIFLLGTGALLVAFGIVIDAVADRIRGNRRQQIDSSAQGCAPRRVVQARSRDPGDTGYNSKATRDDARKALTTLGFKPGVAFPAVDAAQAKLGNDAPVDHVIKEALRQCPKPLSS
jgi:hypothetical protein